ncbi:MAG: ubiquinol-cytochrome c reductase iron-sulfur subunit [Candidatus Brocadiae bacterium]|nr:ubiquinol-cytochrome c reductase iron-sulfur subunit [Candidatus Brocadiia bacterium]
MNDITRKPQPICRRDFLGQIATCACATALGLATVGMARLPFPAVIPGESSKVKIGHPADFPKGEGLWIAATKAFVFRDNEGFFVISGICTHLGCIVAQDPKGFHCPCHGSAFGNRGEVTKGPAPSALPWLEISLASDGQLIVDTQKVIPMGTKLKV